MDVVPEGMSLTYVWYVEPSPWGMFGARDENTATLPSADRVLPDKYTVLVPFAGPPVDVRLTSVS
jgi:hypothetical protein